MDTYFEDDEYGERIEPGQGTALDPLSAGKYCLDAPIWDPREHFLSLFAARIEKATQEWRKLTFRVVESLERKKSLVRTESCGLVLLY